MKAFNLFLVAVLLLSPISAFAEGEIETVAGTAAGVSFGAFLTGVAGEAVMLGGDTSVGGVFGGVIGACLAREIMTEPSKRGLNRYNQVAAHGYGEYKKWWPGENGLMGLRGYDASGTPIDV